MGKMVKTSPKKSTKRSSSSAKAGLIFPAGRIGSLLKKNKYTDRVSGTAAVFLTAVMQYCVSELLRVSTAVARAVSEKSKKKGKSDKKGKQIKPRHICVAVREDEELSKLLSKVTIAGGGVVGGVQTALKEKSSRSKKTTSSKPAKKTGKKEKSRRRRRRASRRRRSRRPRSRRRRSEQGKEVMAS